MKASKMIKNFIILGPQGAGKGTQAQFLAREFSLVWIEAGRLLRKKAWDETKLGEKIGRLQEQGVLVLDSIVTQIIKEEIKKTPQAKGIILDGYPRSLMQLKDLEKILNETKRAKYQAIFIKVSKKITLKRLAGRKTCSKCGKIFAKTTRKTCDVCGGKLIVRVDDRPKAIEKRLKIFHRETKPVAKYFKKKGVLIEINGEKTPDKVHQDVIKKLKKRMK